MAFTVGQNVNVTNNGVTQSGTVIRLGALGSKDSCVVRFSDGSQKAFFGSTISQVSAA